MLFLTAEKTASFPQKGWRLRKQSGREGLLCQARTVQRPIPETETKEARKQGEHQERDQPECLRRGLRRVYPGGEGEDEYAEDAKQGDCDPEIPRHRK